MKIAVVCMQYDYGVPERGLSYEYVNFFQVLVNMGHEVVFFYFFSETIALGKEQMNQKLWAFIEHERPDMAMFSLYTDELDPETTSLDLRYLFSSPRALLNSIRSPKNVEQLKARHFEINSCGAFQLSYYVEGLERQYDIGEEIGIYVDCTDLINKVTFYLKHEKLRENMARKAQIKSMASHRFEHRFEQVFLRMGLNNA